MAANMRCTAPLTYSNPVRTGSTGSGSVSHRSVPPRSFNPFCVGNQLSRMTAQPGLV